jgi:outer membrane murein-binding lipoprotein Lpp
MKMRIFTVVSVFMLIAGCASLTKEKLPAGDIDIYKLYGAEIDTLHNQALRTDSREKFEAAMTLYNNVDFSFVREVSTLEKIFGAHDAHLGTRSHEKQNIIYVYRYRGKRVRFVFLRYNNAVIHSECTDKID